jgi:regulation of enolase protein 1 (concanavalin A-like superfamily)
METGMEWYNEPQSWRREGERILAKADARTDFWRKTHNGSVQDNGHFYFQTVGGGFRAEVRVAGRYSALYDQAGLMVRVDASNWLKCGIEYVAGTQQASAVLTRDWSDWSVVALSDPPAAWFRAEYRAPTIEVHYSLDGESYTMIRQAYLPESARMQVGLMLACPTGDGFEVVFEGYRLSAL